MEQEDCSKKCPLDNFLLSRRDGNNFYCQLSLRENCSLRRTDAKGDKICSYFYWNQKNQDAFGESLFNKLELVE